MSIIGVRAVVVRSTGENTLLPIAMITCKTHRAD
jgi:hypothetical protein